MEFAKKNNDLLIPKIVATVTITLDKQLIRIKQKHKYNHFNYLNKLENCDFFHV